MISRSVASALQVARRLASFISLVLDADDRSNLAPARRDLGVARLARSSSLAGPRRSGICLAIGRADMHIAAKPDDIGAPQCVEKVEQLGVAEPAIRQNRHSDALGQPFRQTGKAEVLEFIALIFLLVIQHGRPQQGRRPPVVGDKA
jgi:hypothetical protein